MKTRIALAALLAVLSITTAEAQQGPPPGVETGPRNIVAGRTYCSVLNWVNLVGFLGVEGRERNAIVRRRVTFSDDGLTWSSAPVSWLVNVLTDTGNVFALNLANDPATGPIGGDYTQTGSKVVIEYPEGDTATWYVSKDGSMIHGSRIRWYLNQDAEPELQIGETINWSLVEIQDDVECDADVPDNFFVLPAP